MSHYRIPMPLVYFRIALLGTVCAMMLACPLFAETIKMKDGRIVYGERIEKISGVAENPLSPRAAAGGVTVRPILAIDDGLRRTFVSMRRVTNVDPADAPQVIIKIPQNVASSGHRIGSVGPLIRITPFDKYGRRIYAMNARGGVVNVVQGITQITPVYTKIEGLMGPKRPFIWDMRIATSSIPRKTLSKILKQTVPQDDVQARLTVARLYLQGERYKDARLELEEIIKAFPEMDGLEREVRDLKQLGARRILKEIQMRIESSQNQFAKRMLLAFPSEDVAGETLEQVKEMLQTMETRENKLTKAKKLLKTAIAAIKNKSQRKDAEKACAEIFRELNFNTLKRMAPLLQLGEDQSMTGEEKTAIALTSWLMGSNSADENLAVALSLVDVRNSVREYLRETTSPKRMHLLQEISAKEGATVENIAKILQRMMPPLDLPPLVDERLYGLFESRIAGLNANPDVRYLVQLPPEYDPHRNYPLIITLNGAGSTPELQVDFWAGGVGWRRDKEKEFGQRNGQAMRHGYITVAIDWRKPHQYQYEYSAREHHAVLSVLRDVCRRFSVDRDRIFLTGHDIGGEAAWDIGLAHPGLWAGVMPFVSVNKKYTEIYWENAEYTSLYVVAGEFDGSNMSDNARSLDRYLRRGFDVTVVEFLGRGHENFSDEIQRIFDWMGRRKRARVVKEFECRTSRRWDSFFWWLELEELPKKAMIEPAAWTQKKPKPLLVRGTILQNNKISVRAGCGKTTIWLSPEMIDFKNRVTVSVDGRRAKRKDGEGEPQLGVLLEDARSRADRQHPYWAVVTVP